jgi:hypothetical protein
MHESEKDRHPRELLEWIAGHGGRVTVRDVQRGLRRYRDNPAQAEIDLQALVDNGDGNWESIRAGARGGQPTSQFCMAGSPDFPISRRGDGDTTHQNQKDFEVPSPSPVRM